MRRAAFHEKRFEEKKDEGVGIGREPEREKNKKNEVVEFHLIRRVDFDSRCKAAKVFFILSQLGRVGETRRRRGRVH